MSRVIHFEIHAEDPDRAMAFYGGLFGWQFQPFGPPRGYWVIKSGDGALPGIDGGLLQRRGPRPESGQPVNGFVCTIQVPALDVYVHKALAQGATLALPRMAVPGIGWLAYVHDPEGNLLGMIQPDSTAQPDPTAG